MVFGRIISVFLFTCVRRICNICQKDEYVIESLAHKHMGQSDFLTYWSNHIGLVTLNVYPSVTLDSMNYMPYPSESRKNDGNTFS